MKEKYEEKGVCCICGGLYFRWGNNAQPVEDGRCCDVCNMMVINTRLQAIMNRRVGV